MKMDQPFNLLDAWFGRFDSTTYNAARLLPGVARYQVGVEELSRGLPL
jgi:hypothetical protein